MRDNRVRDRDTYGAICSTCSGNGCHACHHSGEITVTVYS